MEQLNRSYAILTTLGVSTLPLPIKAVKPASLPLRMIFKAPLTSVLGVRPLSLFCCNLRPRQFAAPPIGAAMKLSLTYTRES